MAKTKHKRQPNLKKVAWLGHTAHQVAEEYMTGKVDELSARISRDFMAMVLLVLHDEFGFGRKRLMRVYTRVADMADALNKGLLTFADIRQTLIEEVDIDIEQEQVQRKSGGDRWSPVRQ